MKKKTIFLIITTRSLIIIKESKKLLIKLTLKIMQDKKKGVLNAGKKDM